MLAYPQTLYKPETAVDLRSERERARLSGPALRAFFKIVAAFGIKAEDARALLGGISNGPYYELKKHPKGRTLDVDKLQRISYLIGIFKALHILHGKELANRWVRMGNANPIFGGKTPLEYMLRGGLPAMQTVRRLVDARRGGGK
jgi:hypothetical protein